MNRSVAHLLTVLGLALAPTVAFAAPETASRLTLDMALRKAMAHHPDVRVQQRQLGIAESERVRAGFWLPDNPTVQAFVVPGGDGEMGLSISQPFEVAGQRFLRVDIAELGVQRSRAEMRAFQRNALADVKTAFFDVLYGQERLQLADTAVTVNADLDRVAQLRLRAADISEVDATVVRLALETAQAHRSDVASQLRVSQVLLNRYLGNPPAVSVAVSGTLAPANDPPMISDVLTGALAQREDLKALDLRAAQLEKQMALWVREIIPDPTLSVSYGRRAISKNSPAGNLASESGTAVQIGVSMPIPVVDYRQAQTARTRADIAVLAAERNALRTRIEQQVSESVGAWQQQLPVASTYQRMMPRLQANVTLLRAAYGEGQVDLQRVLLSQDQLIQTRTALLDVQRQLRQAEVSVDRATGRSAIAEKENL
jgi:outer membrane protein TolC